MIENYTIENFVLEFKDAFSEEFCNNCVSYFQNMEKSGFTAKRDHKESEISDKNVALHAYYAVELTGTQNLSSFFLEIGRAHV